MALPELLARKYAQVRERLERCGRVLVAYSGGVDSTLLAKVARDVLGDGAIAVTAVSASYPRRELREAVALAEEIGIRLEIVHSEELEDENYARNPTNRCYFCKSELFTQLERISRTLGVGHIAYGANADDAGDYRPGMEAAQERGVHAPLLEAGMTKDDVRRLSRELGLRTWDKPAFACLSSRFPYGTRITPENLAQVDAAEDALYERGFRQFRVRHHGEIARIEVPPSEMRRFLDDSVRDDVVERLLALGFRYVSLDLRGYRSGSMNEGLLTLSAPMVGRPTVPHPSGSD
jgi:uncharacterized protein